MEQEKLIPSFDIPLGEGYMDNFKGKGWPDSSYYIAGNLEDRFYHGENIIITGIDCTRKYSDFDEYFGLVDYETSDYRIVKDEVKTAISHEYEAAHKKWLHDGYDLWLTQKGKCENISLFHWWLRQGKETWCQYKDSVRKMKFDYFTKLHIELEQEKAEKEAIKKMKMDNKIMRNKAESEPCTEKESDKKPDKKFEDEHHIPF